MIKILNMTTFVSFFSIFLDLFSIIAHRTNEMTHLAHLERE